MKAIYEDKTWEVSSIDFVNNKVMLVESIKVMKRFEKAGMDYELYTAFVDIGEVNFLIPEQFQMALFNK